MPTGTYSIDATNNTEPLDTRYVADFPAELRAMKTRMNSAISSIGELTGALMSDGTNNMTGKLGVGTVADFGMMLHVAGASKLVGNVSVTGKVDVTGSGFVPSNSTVTNAAHISRGSYGGGSILIDGSHYSGMYASAGALCLGSGTAAGMVQKASIAATSSVFYGETSMELSAVAAAAYAGLRATSAGTYSAYLFLGNASGEKGRIFSDDAGNMSFCVGNNNPAAVLTAFKTFQTYGDEVNIGAGANANQKRLAFQTSSRYAYLCMNADGYINLHDATVGAPRWTTDISGNFTARGMIVSEGDTIRVGVGNVGTKSLLFSNNVRAVNYELAADGSTFRLVDHTAGVQRWTTDVAGNFTAAGNITAYSDERLKHDVQVIHGALDKVKALRGVTFKWNRDNSGGIGFIAQELEQICPELVHNCADIKSVAYGNVTALLVEAVKELRAEVITLRTELATLRGD